MDMVYKKKGKQQDRDYDNAITIGVPLDSDLPKRLQRVSEQTGLLDHELLQKWLTQEESAIHVLQNHGEKIRLTLKQDVADQLTGLMQQMRRTFEQVQSKKLAGAREPVGELPGEDESGERRQALVARVADLRNQGMTLTKIADQFNAEKVPTLSGSGKWHPSTITMLLAKIGRA